MHTTFMYKAMNGTIKTVTGTIVESVLNDNGELTSVAVKSDKSDMRYHVGCRGHVFIEMPSPCGVNDFHAGSLVSSAILG